MRKPENNTGHRDGTKIEKLHKNSFFELLVSSVKNPQYENFY